MTRLFSIAGFLFLFSFPAGVLAQQKVIDSLSRVLASARGEHARMVLLNELSFASYDVNSEKAYQYAREAHELALRQKNKYEEKRSLTLIGYYHYTKGNYEQALQSYRLSARVHDDNKNWLGYNQVMAGNAFMALARYDSAEHYFQTAIGLLIKDGKPSTLAYAYKNLGRLYVLLWQNNEAKQIFEKALDIYRKSSNQRGQADTWFSLADVSVNNADFPEAVRYVEDACAVAERTQDDQLKLNCLQGRGEISSRKGDYTESLQSYFKALELIESKDLPWMLTNIYSGIADDYEGLGQNDMALQYYLEALKAAERIGVKRELGKLFSNLAWIYKNQLDFKLAHEYVNKSLALRQEIHDEHGVSNSYNVLGIIYLQEKKYSEATEALTHSLAIRRRIGHKEGVSACLFNLALVFEEQKQYGQALKYQLEALTMDEVIGNKFSMGISYNSLGHLYTKLHRFDFAEKFLKKGKQMAEETESKTILMNNNLHWSEFYEARHNFSRALDYYKQFSAINDSIYFDINQHKLAELQALYQVEKKDHEIELLNQENKLHENEIALQRAQINQQGLIITGGIAGLVLMALFAVMIYRYNRRMRKAHREIMEQKEEIQSQSEELIDANQTIAEINRKLEEKVEDRTQALSRAYKELDTFFYRSSHDFRRPLTTFLGLAEVAKITVKEKNALELFEKVKDTASNLDKMLVKLQSISDVGSQQLVYKEVMLKELFETICDGFREELQRKGIKTNAEIRLSDPFISYPAMIRIILENLIENAIYFSGVNNPYIQMKAVQTSDYLTLEIQDNGQGIAKEYQDQVFDMYFRANERSKGNGLGLYIVKKAVEKLDGSITLSSVPSTGSTFTIMLPMQHPTIGIR